MAPLTDLMQSLQRNALKRTTLSLEVVVDGKKSSPNVLDEVVREIVALIRVHDGLKQNF
jgi:hypothetical protein